MNNAEVVVMVGTHHLPFDRLVHWADQYAAGSSAKVFVQYGNSVAPTICEGAFSLTQAQMAELRQGAKVLVCLGGPSIMVEWLRSGFRPIVVPRDPALGEHLDEHQILFSQFMASRGWIDLADSSEQLAKLIDEHLNGQAQAVDISGLDSVQAAQNVGRIVEDMVYNRTK